MRVNLRVIKKKIRRSRFDQGRSGKDCTNFEKTMKTLLLQNQQIIIQQQNMMFMIMKQFHPHSVEQGVTSSSNTTSVSSANVNTTQLNQDIIQLNHHHQHQSQQFHHSQPAPATNNQIQVSSQQHTMQPLHSQQHQANEQHQTQMSMFNHHHQMNESQNQSRGQSSDANNNSNEHHHHHMQQVATPAHMQAENITAAYLTPVASEQDPISDTKPDDEDISALLESDALLTSNLLYNPQTDIGQITPYKNHHQQQNHQQQQQHEQTPSYYSSGCESLTTPRVEQQQPRQPTTANINQNVVKNLADSFKSPSKPKINVQILSGSATRNMKNNKAKIIQRMNISEFLRHVHQDDQATSHQHPIKSSASQ